MADTPHVVGVFGPTGSGKTEVAVHVARLLGTEVVNCDPAQCYRGLPILTNQPGPEHDAIAPHRMIGVWPLTHAASVADFARRAHTEIDQLVAANGAAVVTGGSGLYLHAATTVLGFAAEEGDVDEHHPNSGLPADAELRSELERRYETEGAVALHGELAQRDAQAAARVHPNDRKRVVRALEAALAGRTIAPEGTSLWDAPLRHGSFIAGLAVDRIAVRQRIDARTAAMFTRGVLDEVAAVVGRSAEHADVALSQTARRIHGVPDCIGVLRGDLAVDKAVELLAARTRQYAKRQDTWARRWPSLTAIPVDVHAPDPANVATLLVARAREAASSPRGGT